MMRLEGRNNRRIMSRKLKNLSDEFRRGIASALGVPVEAIREDVVEKWVREWARAFVKPEFWRLYVESSSPTRVENATMELFTHLKEVSKPNVETTTTTTTTNTRYKSKGI